MQRHRRIRKTTSPPLKFKPRDRHKDLALFEHWKLMEWHACPLHSGSHAVNVELSDSEDDFDEVKDAKRFPKEMPKSKSRHHDE